MVVTIFEYFRFGPSGVYSESPSSVPMTQGTIKDQPYYNENKCQIGRKSHKTLKTLTFIFCCKNRILANIVKVYNK